MYNINDKVLDTKEPYENIYGKVLKLSIKKQSNATEVTISKAERNNFHIHCVFLTLIVLISLIVFLCGLIRLSHLFLFLIITSLTAQKIFHTVKYEKLLYVSKLGCQITVKYSLGYSTKFIPAKSIRGIFINEVLSKHRVLFVLSILVKDDDNGDGDGEFIIPLFTETKPRLNCLQVVYQNLLD